MAFVKTTDQITVGDRVKTTKKFENSAGYMEIGTEVTVTNIGDRGYDIIDDEGNRIIECGWLGLKKI